MFNINLEEKMCIETHFQSDFRQSRFGKTGVQLTNETCSKRPKCEDSSADELGIDSHFVAGHFYLARREFEVSVLSKPPFHPGMSEENSKKAVFIIFSMKPW